MRFLVAWDGSELSTLALRATIFTLARKGDQLLVYHVANRGRYGASEEFELDALQVRLRGMLEEAVDLRVLVQRRDGMLEDVAAPCSPPCSPAPVVRGPGAGPKSELLTVHEKEGAEAGKISNRIIEFASFSRADVLVMGSMGVKEASSTTYKRTTLGSSAHLAALSAPCSVVLIRPGYRVDPKLRSVFMVAMDGSQHAYHALQLCSDWARYDKDEVVCHVFGPPEFTQPIEEHCTGLLQKLMSVSKVEYAVIPTELESEADVIGDELAETARQCRFRQQAFLVFGACGRQSEDVKSPEASPTASGSTTTLGHVARWCICEAQCSLIIARIKAEEDAPQPESLFRSSTVPADMGSTELKSGYRDGPRSMKNAFGVSPLM